MAKLYFRYGAMNSGKTLDLLKVYYNYKERNMHTIILKPKCDAKGNSSVISRNNSSLEADFLVKKEDNVYDIVNDYNGDVPLNCILVDEAQLLEKHHIDELSDVVDKLDIPVICYGLRCDFRIRLFPGSERLLELADSLEEVKTVCDCGKKAIFNLRFIDGKVTFEGKQVAIDGINNVTYKSFCRRCTKKLQGKGEK